MGQKQSVTGMVLFAAPVGEFDKRVVLLTKEKGKITAFAKGAKRQNSALLAASTPFAFGEFEIYEGRSSNTMEKAEISNYFEKLKQDLKLTYYGMYFLEIAKYYAQEENDERELLLLLYQTLRTLEKGVIEPRLIRCIYELKVLVINGIYPNVFTCQNCGSEEALTHFSAEDGGVLCTECRRQKSHKMGESTLYTLQFIVSAQLQKLYSFTVKDAVLADLEKIIQPYFKQHTEYTFKTLPFIEEW
ncbi:MAG: DNA repair protein RecO [Lachnospiraceae bacterium]